MDSQPSASSIEVARHLVLATLTIGSLLILAFCLTGGRMAEIGFSVLAVGFPVVLMLLGVARPATGLGSPAGPILALLVLLESCLLGMLVARGTVESGVWFLGLPAGAAIQIYGVFLAPSALVALGYALTFDAVVVGSEGLERLRQLAPPEGDD